MPHIFISCNNNKLPSPDRNAAYHKSISTPCHIFHRFSSFYAIRTNAQCFHILIHPSLFLFPKYFCHKHNQPLLPKHKMLKYILFLQKIIRRLKEIKKKKHIIIVTESLLLAHPETMPETEHEIIKIYITSFHINKSTKIIIKIIIPFLCSIIKE